jgi:cell division protein FtsI/penicillin-binding protein 2
MGGRLLHDLHSYGTLDVADVLVKSSNIGMAKIGERIGNEGLYEAAVTFGFGHKTGIELPGEISGILRPLAEWTRYSTGSVPMGQEVAVTPLQLIAAYGALANGGRFISPHLVLRYDGQGAARPVNVVSRAVAPDVAEWLVRKAMRDVVLRGTGGRASLDDYSVFGKTGTAEKRRRVNGDGVPLRHTCWFVCGAPVENPRLLVLVVADEPASGPSHYGGVVAAPCASRLLQKALVHLGVPSVASSSAPPRMQ